jgi:addiction module RelE/StbE family toxin
MRITFDPRANEDLDRIFSWIAKDNRRAAYEMIARIEERIGLLAIPGLAHMGRPGLVARTRELVETPYIVVYTVEEERDEVIVLAIVHGAQDR